MRRMLSARSDERGVAPVIAEVLLVAVSVTLAATLFVLATQITSETAVGPAKPLVFFTPVQLDHGNATITIGGTSVVLPASQYRLALLVDDSVGAPRVLTVVGMAMRVPGASGTYMITWTDVSGAGTLAGGDSFLVTGGHAALPAGHSYRLTLLWTDGSAIAAATWST